MQSVKKLNTIFLNTRYFVNYPLLTCKLSTTPVLPYFHRLWREMYGIPRFRNQHGPLTDRPDWSYLDGRPAPLGVKQKMKYKERIEQAKLVVKLLNEMDAAEQMYEKKTLDEIESKERNILAKLKAKGGSEKVTQENRIRRRKK